jgi:hypothetical protein
MLRKLSGIKEPPKKKEKEKKTKAADRHAAHEAIHAKQKSVAAKAKEAPKVAQKVDAKKKAK